MEIYQVDENGQLFISPDVDDWKPVMEHGITVIFDLDSDLDVGVPNIPNEVLYLYYPFDDKDLPDLHRLHAIAQLGASMIQNGHKVLSHCGMGHNRSALLAGLILTYLGVNGTEAVTRIRERRMGALYNHNFANYLQSQESVQQRIIEMIEKDMGTRESMRPRRWRGRTFLEQNTINPGEQQ
jgi:protein-tyrosine phosphatase